jgi:membrane protease YdiL (CAAX protease family)
VTVSPPAEGQPRWGVREAIVGLIAAQIIGIVAGTVILIASGRTSAEEIEDLSLAVQVVLQLPLWAGLLGVPLWYAYRKGAGPAADLGLRVRGVDIPIGVGLGLATQIAAGLLYLPFLDALDIDQEDLSEPARQLTDRAEGTLGVILLIVIVGIGAPIAEEIFYRGFFQRALMQRLQPWPAILVTAVVFGASHLQPLQFPALVLFGVVAGLAAHRTGRLGTSIAMHVVFNMTAVISLLSA